MMAEKDSFTDAPAALSRQVPIFRGLGTAPHPTHIMKRGGMCPTPLQTQDPCKVYELQKKHGERGGTGRWSRSTPGRCDMVHPSHLGPQQEMSPRTCCPWNLPPAAKRPECPKQYVCTQRVRTSCYCGTHPSPSDLQFAQAHS